MHEHDEKHDKQMKKKKKLTGPKKLAYKIYDKRRRKILHTVWTKILQILAKRLRSDQRCFGFLGLISAMLMLEFKLGCIATSDDRTHVAL